jgi:glycerophosphoryl diester phosphodiesterase
VVSSTSPHVSHVARTFDTESSSFRSDLLSYSFDTRALRPETKFAWCLYWAVCPVVSGRRSDRELRRAGLVAVSIGEDSAVSPPPLGFAHRGARADAPENTLRSFALALELGASGLESDVWLSADGVAVLDHDGVVGARWRRFPISSLPRQRLPAHIPTLAELYLTCGTAFALSLDVKDPAAIDAVLRDAAQAGATQRLWLCHPDLAVLKGWRSRAGGAQLVHSSALKRFPGGLDSELSALVDAGADALNLRAREWSAPAVAAVHRVGARAFGWDVQTRAALQRAVALGLDAVYSDHVATMMSVLRRQESPED